MRTNLDPVIVHNWQQGVIFDEVGQKSVGILANLIYLWANCQEKVVFGTAHRAVVAHLECS